MEMNLHYRLSDGTLVSKREVDKAIDLVTSLKGGFTLVELSDEELFSKGNKVEAIRRFREKHNTGLTEAKEAIEFLRGE